MFSVQSGAHGVTRPAKRGERRGARHGIGTPCQNTTPYGAEAGPAFRSLVLFSAPEERHICRTQSQIKFRAPSRGGICERVRPGRGAQQRERRGTRGGRSCNSGFRVWFCVADDAPERSLEILSWRFHGDARLRRYPATFRVSSNTLWVPAGELPPAPSALNCK
jgi:hypothetical protein